MLDTKMPAGEPVYMVRESVADHCARKMMKKTHVASLACATLFATLVIFFLIPHCGLLAPLTSSRILKLRCIRKLI